MRTRRLCLLVSLTVLSLAGAMGLPSSTAHADTADTAQPEEGGEEGGDTGLAAGEGGETETSTEFDNGFQGAGPAELAGETGGGCFGDSASAMSIGFLGLLGLAGTRRRRS